MQSNLKLYNFLFENKQSLIKLGYPEIIAELLDNKFGNISFLIAKWLREHLSFGPSSGQDFSKNWWRTISDFKGRDPYSLKDLVDLYYAAIESKEKYNEINRELELYVDEDEVFDRDEILPFLKSEIEKKLFSNGFFTYYTLIRDIMSGKLRDLKPYKSLSFEEAKDKYDKKRIFSAGTTIKTYENGWSWINVGDRCQLVGKMMKNCGSAGVMSGDPDRTILTLFDNKNKPHVMVTYSPNEKRISGSEGAASSEVKENYHDYVLDIAEYLGADFDWDKSKSKMLKLKSALKGQINNIKIIEKTFYDEWFKIFTKDDKQYYTDSYNLVFAPEIDKMAEEKFGGDAKKLLNNIFNGHHRWSYDFDMPKIIKLYNFIQGER